MIWRVAMLLPATAAGLACSAAVQLPPLSADHPACPEAPEVAFVDPSSSLRPEAQDATRTTTPVGAPLPSREATDAKEDSE